MVSELVPSYAGSVRAENRTFGLQRHVVVVIAAIGTVIAAVAAPGQNAIRHLDHKAFLDTVRRMRLGDGFYDAFDDAMGSIGADVDQLRVFRQPLLFEFWAALPASWLQPAFFVIVVFGSTWAASRISRRPAVGLAVGQYLAVAGVYGGIDTWLLCELWAVPFMLGSCASWLQGRDKLAAGLAAVAVLIRETAAPLPIGFALASLRSDRSTKPWLASLAVSAVGLFGHWWFAASHLEPGGTSVALWRTGGIGDVFWMTNFLVLPALVGMAVWMVGVVLIWRSALRPAIGVALIPLLGLFVSRPYWGLLTMPMCILALGGLPTRARRPAVIDLRDAVVHAPQQQPAWAATTTPVAVPATLS
jgi:hypothetical protein